MNRITPERCINGYKNSGLKVIFGSFGDGETCGCGITAVIRSESNLDVISNTTSDVCEKLGIDIPYFWSFIDGFDNTNEHVQSFPSSIGYQDGQACRSAVIKEFGITTGGDKYVQAPTDVGFGVEEDRR